MQGQRPLSPDTRVTLTQYCLERSTEHGAVCGLELSAEHGAVCGLELSAEHGAVCGLEFSAECLHGHQPTYVLMAK